MIPTPTGLKTRPTIGLLIRTCEDRVSQIVWKAVAAAAQEYDLNLLTLTGNDIRSPHGFKAQANILYDLLRPEQFDGLIIWASVLQTFIPAEEMAAFVQRFRRVPVVTGENPFPGIPAIMMDNTRGVHDVMTHLIDGHGYRRIAFVQGPAWHRGMQERYQTYQDTLTAHGLTIDPRLISPHCTDWKQGGAKFAHLLDERGLQPQRDFDAVVVPSAVLAIDVLETLQARGFKVPHDAAVATCGDMPEMEACFPSITTVRPAFEMMARQAVERVLDLIAGRPVPEQIPLPMDLIIRQSCGCVERSIQQAGTSLTEAGTSLTGSVTLAPDCLSAEQRRQIAARVAEHIPGDIQQALAQATALCQAFWEELANHLTGSFLVTLSDLLVQSRDSGQEIEDWQAILSALRQHMLPCLPDKQRMSQAEALWHQGRMLIGKASGQIQKFHTLQQTKRTQRLEQLGAQLIKTFDVTELLKILAAELPNFGIRGAYLALYEQPQPYTYPQPGPEWSQMRLAFTESGPCELGPKGQRFPSAQFVPPALRPQERAIHFVVQPLYFRDEQLGLLTFDISAPEGDLYETLQGTISSALQGAILMQRIQAHTAEITRQKYILDTFMANIPDSIYFKDRDSRILRSNTAHAHSFGVRESEELIGKTDFDFFPVEQARPKFEEEQQIIRTGQPILAMEEPDAQGKWSLTTKMPLRDEHGAIIGTFGISRDITPLKQAQQALQQAYSEISILNHQLTEDNVRMGAELNVVKQLQQMILPRPEELQQIPGFEIVGYMQPADEVGGDYYDVLHDDGRLHIGIGDVTGHGLESGVIMLMTQTAIRTLIEHGETDPVKFVNTLNRLIYKNAARIGTDKNLTFALVQSQYGQFKLVGQHEDVLVIRRGGQVERMSTMDLGFPVGLEPDIDQWVHAATITLQPGDGLVLYTDGITEAENTEQQQYGLNRLCAVISQHWNDSAEGVKQAVVDDVKRYIGQQKVYDDLTLVVLKQR